MLLYHRTPHAEAILANGFQDGTGYYLTHDLRAGVWFSDVPLAANEGAKGDTVLSLDIPEALLVGFEWREKGKPYREFLIPAALANHHGPPAVFDHDYAGCTRGQMLGKAAALEGLGSEHGRRESAQIRAAIPFLRRHGMLAKAGHGQGK